MSSRDQQKVDDAISVKHLTSKDALNDTLDTFWRGPELSHSEDERGKGLVYLHSKICNINHKLRFCCFSINQIYNVKQIQTRIECQESPQWYVRVMSEWSPSDVRVMSEWFHTVRVFGHSMVIFLHIWAIQSAHHSHEIVINVWTSTCSSRSSDPAHTHQIMLRSCTLLITSCSINLFACTLIINDLCSNNVFTYAPWSSMCSTWSPMGSPWSQLVPCQLIAQKHWYDESQLSVHVAPFLHKLVHTGTLESVATNTNVSMKRLINCANLMIKLLKILK